MKQQINLYQAEFHLKLVVLPAQQMAAIAISALAVMVLVSVLLAVLQHRGGNEMQRLTQAVEQDRQAIATMQSTVAARHVEPDLEAAVFEASRQLKARQRILEWVEQSSDDRSVLFSALLEALGRQHVNGLWLSDIQIHDGGHSLAMSGSALQSELLPKFLALLQAEPAFSGREFRKVSVKENGRNAGVLNFVLKTRDKADTDVADNKPDAFRQEVRR